MEMMNTLIKDWIIMLAVILLMNVTKIILKVVGLKKIKMHGCPNVSIIMAEEWFPHSEYYMIVNEWKF